MGKVDSTEMHDTNAHCCSCEGFDAVTRVKVPHTLGKQKIPRDLSQTVVLRDCALIFPELKAPKSALLNDFVRISFLPRDVLPQIFSIATSDKNDDDLDIYSEYVNS